MQMPGRFASSDSYGFNGAEKDDEIRSDGNALEFGGRSIYDGRIGRFASVDPRHMDFPFMSPYCFAANGPIRFIDVEGKGPGDPQKNGGTYLGGFGAGFSDAFTGLWDAAAMAVAMTALNSGYMPFDVAYEIHVRTAQFWGLESWEQELRAAYTMTTMLNNSSVSEIASALGDALSEFMGDITFENGLYDAGYAHGMLVADIVMTVATFGTATSTKFLTTLKGGKQL
jgi:RHS repeat-associated protein